MTFAELVSVALIWKQKTDQSNFKREQKEEKSIKTTCSTSFFIEKFQKMKWQLEEVCVRRVSFFKM